MLRVSYGAMDAAAGALNTAMNSLTSQLGDLQRKNSDLAAAWQGCGSDEYQNLARRFHDQALQVVQDLKPMQDFLNGSNDGFRAAGKAAQSAFS